MSGLDLSGRRMLVVGASSGIGRALARGSVRAGARVALNARRRHLLDEAVDEAGGGTAVVGDIGRGDCRRIVVESVEALGGVPLDVVVLAAGTGVLVPMVDADEDQWSEVMATNVIGLNQLIRAAVPQMAAGGIIAALSSETVGRPRLGLGLYGASKAALDQSLLSWQVEHPTLRFCRVTVGATQPTGFGAHFEPGFLTDALHHWIRRGEMQRRFMAAAEVADMLLGVLAGALENPGVNVEQVRLRSPSDHASSLGEVEFL